MDTQSVICSLKFSEDHSFKEQQKAIDNCEIKVQVYWAKQISESVKADDTLMDSLAGKAKTKQTTQ